MSARTPKYFTPALFTFLKELKPSNERRWFQAQKHRYEDSVKDPALRFISDFGSALAGISRHFMADPRPVGGSLFRIYRDTRFAKDKSPYKTHVGLHFRHREGKDAHAPGFYLHLEPGHIIAGAGIWRPDTATLKKIRDGIVDDPARWRRTLGHPRIAGRFQLGGDSLTRPPRGYDPEHPLVEDLKRKDYYLWTGFTQKEATSPDFLDRFIDTCRAASPFVRFLCRTVDVPF